MDADKFDLEELDLTDLNLQDVGEDNISNLLNHTEDSELDISSQLLELSMFLEEDEYNEDTFDGKYYISYLGLNPLTVYKEDNNVLKALIYANYHKDKLSFLIEDLNNFIKGAKHIEVTTKRKYVKLKDSGTELETKQELRVSLLEMGNIISNLREKVDTLENIQHVLSYDVSSVLPKRKDTVSVIEIIRDSEIQERIVDYVLSPSQVKPNMISREEQRQKEREFKLDIIRQLITSLGAFLDTKEVLEGGSKNDELISTYKNTIYYYSPSELEVLSKLRFPTILAGKEDLIKDKINSSFTTKTTTANIALTDWHEEKIYNMFNVYNCMENNIKLSSFYNQ